MQLNLTNYLFIGGMSLILLSILGLWVQGCATDKRLTRLETGRKTDFLVDANQQGSIDSGENRDALTTLQIRRIVEEIMTDQEKLAAAEARIRAAEQREQAQIARDTKILNEVQKLKEGNPTLDFSGLEDAIATLEVAVEMQDESQRLVDDENKDAPPATA
jgi:hypothetical protein